MTLSDLQILIGDLTNDPGHDRYTLTHVGTELDNAQNAWNMEAKIIKRTHTYSTTQNTRLFTLSSLESNPLAITRVTFAGLELHKRSSSYFDLFSGSDWTLDQGTPTEFSIDLTVPNIPYLAVHPYAVATNDPLIVEYIAIHVSMSAASDVPFTATSGLSDFLLRPYDWGLAYDVAARLLARDPSPINASKTTSYAGIARNILNQVIQVFKALEAEEPKRMRGGRYWNLGTSVRSR